MLLGQKEITDKEGRRASRERIPSKGMNNLTRGDHVLLCSLVVVLVVKPLKRTNVGICFGGFLLIKQS